MSNRPRHYRKRAASTTGQHKLADLLTINEAAALWGRSRDTIYRNIQSGRLTARQSGSIWLISKDSLVEFYGHSPLILRRRKNQ